MNSNKTKSFEEFLSLRKFSSSNNQIPENLPASASLLKIIPYENPEKYHSIEKKHKNADLNLKKKNISKNTKKENKVQKSREIKDKKPQKVDNKKEKNEELRLLKLQAMEKERFLEKRKKAVITIQKRWRGFAQYCKFQAFKYIK